MTRELLTKAEYAKRRGCTEAAVRRAVREGRISEIDGRIDPVVADAQWLANTQVRAGSRPAGAVEPLAGDPPAGEGDAGYWASRARRERTEADLAELRLAEQRGQLVRAAAVRAAAAPHLLRARDRFLNMSARLAPLLAVETDETRIANLIDDEVSEALAELARAPSALRRSRES